MMKEYIRHRGVVERVDNRKVFVKIEQAGACSGCHASGACMSAEKQERIIEVDDDSGDYAVGEEVTVGVQSSKGLEAVTAAFVIPLMLLIVVFILAENASGSETTGGLAGLASLLPYYLLLYALRDKIGKKFTFTLAKPDIPTTATVKTTNC